MQKIRKAWRLQTRLHLSSIVAAIIIAPVGAIAQMGKPVQLPNGPAAPGFDIGRFSSAGNGWFKTFYVAKYDSLQNVLKAGRVAPDTRVLVTETAGGKVALLTDQMAFHHIAEGEMDGKAWMATF
jgi:hypothetical protein